MAEITVHYEGPIVTRAEAKAAGLAKYFDGKICVRNHQAQRTTANGGCTVCNLENQVAWRLNNPDAAREKDALHNAKHRDKNLARKRQRILPCKHCGNPIDFPEAKPGVQRISRPRYCSDECRLYSKVSKEPGQGPKGDCWEFQGGKHRFGYGMINMSGTKASDIVTAHTVAWEIANGMKVPEGMYVCHTCDHPPCCRVDHPFLGTPKDNYEDMMAKGRHPLSKNYIF